jgi:hypothetical protein
MTEEHWIRFDRSDHESFPPPAVEVVVETERGQTFPATFIQNGTANHPLASRRRAGTFVVLSRPRRAGSWSLPVPRYNLFAMLGW